MTPYKSYAGLKGSYACFFVAYNFILFMAPGMIGTNFLDMGGLLVLLFVVLGSIAVISFLCILFHEIFGWQPEVKHAIGENQVFIDGKTYSLAQISALHLQFGNLHIGPRGGQFDDAPCLLIIFFADGSCCAASNPSVSFISHLRKFCPKAKFKIEDLFRHFVKTPLFFLLAGVVLLLCVKLGILPE